MVRHWIDIRVRVSAVLVGKNLAVHKAAPQGIGDGEDHYPTPYVITHIASGLAAWPCPSEMEGVFIAEKIDYLFDDAPAQIDMESADYQSWIKGVIPVIQRIVGVEVKRKD